MTARSRRGPRVPSTSPAITGDVPVVEWSTLKSEYTKALDYRHICAYDGPVVDCPVCFDGYDGPVVDEAKIKEDS